MRAYINHSFIFYTNYCLKAIQEVCEVKCSITLESYDTRISTRSKQYPAVAQQTEEGLNSAKVSDSFSPPGETHNKKCIISL